LQGIAACVRERRTWSVFVEEVEHQRIPNLRESGYANEQYLSAVMRAECLCTPAQYRREHCDHRPGQVL